MSSRFANWSVGTAVLVGLVAAMAWWSTSGVKIVKQPVLRVCAEPHAMPYSNRAGEGFENKIAKLLAEDQGARLEYNWLVEWRGSFEDAMSRGECDVTMGLPVGISFAEVTEPYYRSSYVMISREDGPRYDSLDDPRLQDARIGIQAIGDDFANTPATFALARRNLLDNMAIFLMHSTETGPMPAEELVDAVASGEVDVGIEWGPPAAFYAAEQPVELLLTEIQADPDLIFTYEVGIGVNRAHSAEYHAAIQDFLDRESIRIDQILASYSVPLSPPPRFEEAKWTVH